MAPRVGRSGLPADIPGNAVNVNCGDYFQRNEKSIEKVAIGTPSHSWHIGDALFTKDMYHTINGDIDRHRIPTRVVKDGELRLVEDLAQISS